MDLPASSLVLIGLCAFLIGLSKSGLPGLGILVVPLMAMAMPARISTGLLLPMLVMGDLLAVSYYRRHAVWPHLLRLLPWTVAGIVIGCIGLGHVTDRQLGLFIGGVVLALLILHQVRERLPVAERLPHSIGFAALMGLAAGVTTMMANAAGPIAVLYLLAMRLPKNEFIGTGAWFFLVINAVKVPFSMHLHLITLSSLTFNLCFLPLIGLGAVAGVLFARRVPERLFGTLVQVLTLLAAIRLLWSAWSFPFSYK